MTAGLWTTTYHISCPHSNKTKGQGSRAGAVCPVLLQTGSLDLQLAGVLCTLPRSDFPFLQCLESWLFCGCPAFCQGPSFAQVLIFNQELVCLVAILILAASPIFFHRYTEGHSRFHIGSRRKSFATRDDPAH